MPAMDPIDLSPTDLTIVLHILRRYVPEREVVAFGSRATWTTRPGSDLDLAVLGQMPLSAGVLAAMKDAFDESSLTFAVDIVDWAATKESFRKIIRRDQILIKPAEPPASPDDWRELTIGDLADVFDGPHATPPKVDAGPIFLGISNLVNGRLDLTEVEHISSEDYERWTRRVEPRAGDVVFSYETRLGEAARIPEGLKCCLGRRMGLLRAKPDQVDPRFLLYAFLGPDFQDTIRSRTIHGSTVDRIPLVDLPRFPIRIPKRMSDQRRIAEILGALDDKVELNRRMNEMLESIASTLFRRLFVDADEVNGIWPRSSLGAVVERCGGTLQTGPFGSQLHADDYVANGVPVIMPKNLTRRRVLIDGIARIRTSDAERLSRHRVREGDIVYSRRGDVEQHALIRHREEGWLCGTGCLLIRMGPRWPSSLFVSLALDQPEIREWLVRHAVGATMPNLNTSILSRVPIVVPPDDLLRRFHELVEPLDSRMALNDAEVETLVDLRDTLLPKLLSGELRVATAEQELAANL